MKKILFLLLCLGLMGCASAYRINRISLGMPKEEVIKELGQPVSVSAKAGTEYLNYRFAETSDDDFLGNYTPYFVRIVNGKVESYGRLGDFDSTKIPEQKSIIDLNINKDK